MLLVFSSRNPFWFSIAFTSYSVALVFATKYMNVQIETAIRQSRLRAAADLKIPELAERAIIILAAVDVLDAYFIGRPTIRRLIAILVFSVLGLIVGIWSMVSESEILALLTYGIFIVILLVSEIVIGRWRIERDKQLKAISEQLREYERSHFAHKGT